MYTWTKEIILNTSADHAYKHLYSYVTGKYKVIDERDPSNIKVKLRRTSYLNINIIPEETSTRIQFKFDFSKEFLMWILYCIFVFLVMTLIVGFPSGTLFAMSYFGISVLWYFPDSRGKIVSSAMDDFISFLSSEGITIKKIDYVVEHELEKPTKETRDINIIYERLIEACSAIHCGERQHARQYIEHKLRSYLERGLNREEAIIKLAEKEGLLEWAEAKPKPKPQLPPETLYQRLLYKYSVYGRSISALEYRIEEYMWEGLSREEAITRLAEEEGVT